MSTAHGHENHRFGRWGPAVQAVVLLIVAGPLVADVVDGPSLWNLAFVAAWTSAAVALGRVLVRDYRRARRTNSTVQVRPIAPGEVPPSDVYQVVATTHSRTDAIELLRQRHPGLGLIDAANLVNNVLGGPNRA